MSGGVPPSSRSRARGGYVTRGKRDLAGFRNTRKVANLFERFTGHEAQIAGTVEFPDLDGQAVAVIGDCDGVLYSTVRDGKAEKYIHEFAAADRPLLCVTADGRQLLLIRGRYKFGERGIVDKSDKSR